jgi:hypothetical protein
MGKQSPFRALVDRQLEENSSNIGFDSDTTPLAPAQSGDQSLKYLKSRGKSSDPNYQRLTVYLRRDTILDLKRRIVGTNVELSDIVQEAVDRWGRSIS